MSHVAILQLRTVLLKVLEVADAVWVVLRAVVATHRLWLRLSATIDCDVVWGHRTISQCLIVVSEQIVVHIDYRWFWNILLVWRWYLRQCRARVVGGLVDCGQNLAVLVRLKHVEVLVVEEEVLLFVNDCGEVVHQEELLCFLLWTFSVRGLLYQLLWKKNIKFIVCTKFAK